MVSEAETTILRIMTDARLKAEIWVKAQLRLCDIACIPAVVVRRGDADAGSVLLKINRLGGGCRVLGRAYTETGERAWLPATGDAPVKEDEADAYIRRQLDFDPDLWVLEIEDPEDRYSPDAPIL